MKIKNYLLGSLLVFVSTTCMASTINIVGCDSFPGGLLTTIQSIQTRGIACMQTGSVATKAEASALSAIFNSSQTINFVCGAAGSTVTLAGKSYKVPNDSFGRALVSPDAGAPGMILNSTFFSLGINNKVKRKNILFHEMMHWLNISSYEHNDGYDSASIAANACFPSSPSVYKTATILLKQTRTAGTQPTGYLANYTKMIMDAGPYTVYFTQYRMIFSTLANALRRLVKTNSSADSAEISLAIKELAGRKEAAAKMFEKARLTITPSSLPTAMPNSTTPVLSSTIWNAAIDGIAVSAGNAAGLMYKVPTAALVPANTAATAFTTACNSLSTDAMAYVSGSTQQTGQVDFYFNARTIRRFIEYAGLPPKCSGGTYADFAVQCPSSLTPTTLSTNQLQFGLEKSCFCKMYVGPGNTPTGYRRTSKTDYLNACSQSGTTGTATFDVASGQASMWVPSAPGNGYPWQGGNYVYSSAHPSGSGTWSGTTQTPVPPIGAVYDPFIPGGPISDAPDANFKNPYNGGASTRVGPNGTTLTNVEIKQLMMVPANNSSGNNQAGVIMVSPVNCPACQMACMSNFSPTVYQPEASSCSRRMIDETHYIDTYYGVRQQ